ncbi:MAG: pyrroloquinoline-quinone synthase PqqC [Halieaceae bacterium]|jgi:pyrroloquinoline-quinone synthase|nr:pyrroloquinoline-quinone synthase PqqC [Halieaceae bacterium]
MPEALNVVVSSPETTAAHDDRRAWSREAFEARLRAKGSLYHIHHPYHRAMYAGELSREQIQAWVANRYYYQIQIPIKDAAVLANCPDQAVRQHWIQRILDHDGHEGDRGGIEAWLQLGEAVGLHREEVQDLRHVLPGVRFAVDAYVSFARRATWQEAACSSLTEMFAPEIHQSRLDSWPDHYQWIDGSGLSYFRKRLSEARRDVEHGLRITLDHFRTREQQEHALDILQFKLNVLWSLLDALTMACVHRTPPFHSCPDQSSLPENLVRVG